MLRFKCRNHCFDSLIVRLDPRSKLRRSFGTLFNEKGTSVRRRDIDEEKLAPTIRVNIQNQTLILSHEFRNKDAGFVLPECISDAEGCQIRHSRQGHERKKNGWSYSLIPIQNPNTASLELHGADSGLLLYEFSKVATWEVISSYGTGTKLLLIVAPPTAKL